MGNFLAKLATIAEWMLQPDQLEYALNRASIFQESAFGAFDSSGIDIVLDDIRSLGQSLCTSPNRSKANKYRAEQMSKLLDRRICFAFATV